MNGAFDSRDASSRHTSASLTARIQKTLAACVGVGAGNTTEEMFEKTDRIAEMIIEDARDAGLPVSGFASYDHAELAELIRRQSRDAAIACGIEDRMTVAQSEEVAALILQRATQ